LDEIDDPFVNGPAFIQERLETPDIRIFRVGEDLFVAFYLHSPSIDYREHQDAIVTYIEDKSAYEEYLQPLIKLSDHLGLEYCAVDLKRKQGTEDKFKFLEINTLPMFSEFDKKSEGKIAKGIVDLLHRNT
jgi:glutathione synthase/RimK-type ligase-like ATP-grasp enzyme